MNARRRRRLRLQRRGRARRRALWFALERQRPVRLIRYELGPVAAHVDLGVTWFRNRPEAGVSFGFDELFAHEVRK